MSTTNPSRHNSNAIVDEHARLDAIFNEVTNASTQRQGNQKSLQKLVDELRRQVEEHFQHEEVGGYFHQLLTDFPLLRPNVADLLYKHAELRAKLNALHDHAYDGPVDADWWETLESRVNDFNRAFEDHEHKENRLIQEAYATVEGTKD